MQTQIETLKGKIKADYINWTTAGGTKELSGYFKETVDNFDDSITVKTGKKYIKIIRDNGVWGFIVNTDDDKLFKKGDIAEAISVLKLAVKLLPNDKIKAHLEEAVSAEKK